MSFTAGTGVMLASGIAVPIASLKPGNKVIATNTRTGRIQAEPVAAVLDRYDANGYDLRVNTAHGSAVTGTTGNHPFWDQTARPLGQGHRPEIPNPDSAGCLRGWVGASRSG